MSEENTLAFLKLLAPSSFTKLNFLVVYSGTRTCESR